MSDLSHFDGVTYCSFIFVTERECTTRHSSSGLPLWGTWGCLRSSGRARTTHPAEDRQCCQRLRGGSSLEWYVLKFCCAAYKYQNVPLFAVMTNREGCFMASWPSRTLDDSDYFLVLLNVFCAVNAWMQNISYIQGWADKLRLCCHSLRRCTEDK